MGLWLYRRRARDHAKAEAALTWPRARVTASTVRVTTETSSGTDASVDNTYYVPQVWFAYEVGGTSYQGSRISYAELKSTNKKKTVDLVAKYPVGAEPEIAYDPANPAESVIELGTKGTSPFNFNVVFLFVASVVSIVAGVAIQVFGPH